MPVEQRLMALAAAAAAASGLSSLARGTRLIVSQCGQTICSDGSICCSVLLWLAPCPPRCRTRAGRPELSSGGANFRIDRRQGAAAARIFSLIGRYTRTRSSRRAISTSGAGSATIARPHSPAVPSRPTPRSHAIGAVHREPGVARIAQHDQKSVGRHLGRLVEPVEQVAVPVGLQRAPFAGRGRAAARAVFGALEHRRRGDLVQRQIGRRRLVIAWKRCEARNPGTVCSTLICARYQSCHSARRSGCGKSISTM